MTAVIEGMLVETGYGARLRIEGDRLVSIERLVAAPDVWIAPGLIDVQVNGYAGHDANSPEPSAATIAAMVEALWERGVTGVCPTICTNSEEQIRRCLAAVAEACESDARIGRSVVGVHVEGPFISREDGPRGAHPLEHIRPPSVDEYRRWQRAADGRIRIVTLSPEYAEAPEFIRAITDDGVVAAIGHTAADEEQIRAAVDAGARFSTHLGNGAHAHIRRHPNYIWELLGLDGSGGRGTVRAGMAADLTVFALEDGGARLRVVQTWVGGEAVYVRH